ncbi:GNAT family N-acetyltransferase [Klebsiella pneumoniae]|uniref:GNAT family N-acetyltransferase n=1 Tax=Enterobacteriaceae TaxID=543 RepID=UPI001E5A31E0|nr:GNAT family N-acetyltransferase [Klebsiella pneumoniae]MCD5767411.1 GNAT family N-acetyltransferase [Klebsiella pneumoniae]UGN03071.1 GNAT family N-acetyltransferase [Klebsiella pneumoniae]
MDITIKEVQKKDYRRARQFAISGMHLSWYTSSRLHLLLYIQHYWNYELLHATHLMGAYSGDKLYGVLIAKMNDQPAIYSSILRQIFVAILECIISNLYGHSGAELDKLNMEMLQKNPHYSQFDGEITFFAVAPETKGAGIGTLLLKELEDREKGKKIYLFTDTGSTFQFYQKRGFQEAGKKRVHLKIGPRTLEVTSYLFCKRL